MNPYLAALGTAPYPIFAVFAGAAALGGAVIGPWARLSHLGQGPG